MPHGGESLVTKDDVDNTGSVHGRVGVDGSSDLLDAAHDNLLFSLGVGDDRVGTSTLTVETEVLGERLEEHDVVGVLLEESKGVGVLLEVTTGESLVGRVEGGEKLLSLDDLKDLLPLALSRVDTGRVVGADVEHDNGVVLGSVKVFLEALEVESLGLGVVVAIVLPLVTSEFTDGSVNGPGGVGDEHIDILVGVPLGEEGETESEGTSSRDGLSTGDSAFLASLGALAVSKGEALLDIGVNTLDGRVLVIHVTLEDDLLSASDAREDEGLASIISVGSHTEKNLLGVGILLERVVESENRVRGGGGKSSPGGEASSALRNNLAVCTLDEASEHRDFQDKN